MTAVLPDAFAQACIESRFSVVLEEALAYRLGEDGKLELVVGERPDELACQHA
jgi:hypothetical protein